MGLHRSGVVGGRQIYSKRSAVRIGLLVIWAFNKSEWMKTRECIVYRACFCIRWTMRRLVSRKRWAQLEMQSVSQEESLLPGLLMHLSQQVSVNFAIICWTAAFWFSSWMKACMAAVVAESVLSSMFVLSALLWIGNGTDLR